MLFVACVIFCYTYILDCVVVNVMLISGKNKRRLNNHDIPNNDEQTEAYRQDGEGPLQDKSVKDDTKVKQITMRSPIGMRGMAAREAKLAVDIVNP